MSEPTTTLSSEFVIKALDHAPQGVLVSGADGNIRWCNQTLAAWLDTTPASIAGCALDTMLQQYLSKPTEQEPEVFAITGEDDTPPRWLRQTTLRIDTGGDTQNAVFFADISQERMLHQRLEQLETIEPVSRLFNRRAMLVNLDPLISRSRRYENPLSVITMELLNLEDINATYGEAAANHAILELSHLLKDQLRWADIISRTDDTHIVIILPETSKHDAGHLAEKINSQVAELQIRYEAIPDLNLQACYGVASWEKGNDSLMLLRNASQAMSRARNHGAGFIEVA